MSPEAPLDDELAGMLAALLDRTADPSLRARAAGFVIQNREEHGPRVFAEVVRAMDPSEPLVLLIAIAEALGDAGPDAAPTVAALMTWLDAPRAQVRYWATHALGRIGPAARVAEARLRQLAEKPGFQVLCP